MRNSLSFLSVVALLSVATSVPPTAAAEPALVEDVTAEELYRTAAGAVSYVVYLPCALVSGGWHGQWCFYLVYNPLMFVYDAVAGLCDQFVLPECTATVP